MCANKYKSKLVFSHSAVTCNTMNTTIFKNQVYQTLVLRRKKCSLCADNFVTNSVSLNYETENIGKWSDWQDSIDARY